MPNLNAQMWLDKAHEDEQIVVLVRKNGGPWNMAAYHIQQASEKYIKATLVQKGIAPIRSHDLEQLISLIPEVTASESVLAAAGMTSSYAWVTRYPGGAAFTQSDIDVAEKDLQTIKDWVLSVIK